MKPAIFTIIVMLSGLHVSCAWGLSDCKLHVHALDENGNLVIPYAVGPEHVASIATFNDDRFVAHDEIAWKVHLTPEGAELNYLLTRANIGRQIAILCNGVELIRPYVRDASRESFTLLGLERP